MRLRKALIVLVICIALLFLLPVCAYYLDLGPDPNLIQAAGLAVVLVGSFLGGHYQLKNLQLTLREERKKEIRQQRLKSLDSIESWLDDANSTLEDITVLAELSGKDETDNTAEKVKSIKEKLLRLKIQGLTPLTRAANIDKEQLFEKVFSVWALLDKHQETLTRGEVSRPFLAAIPLAKKALDEARTKELEQN